MVEYQLWARGPSAHCACIAWHQRHRCKQSDASPATLESLVHLYIRGPFHSVYHLTGTQEIFVHLTYELPALTRRSSVRFPKEPPW